MGGQQRDLTGDELDGEDETLIPCDFETAGQITDDELYEELVQVLPNGCRLWVVFDCCHSGTALDLRYRVQIASDGRSATLQEASGRRVATSGQVLFLSGCKDSQTSAD